MLSLHHALVAALLAPLFVVADERQQPLLSTWNGQRHTAIIGAGVAGASTAFRLNELAGLSPFATVNIYESESNVGGRIQTIPRQPGFHPALEDGATSFCTDDWCLMTAMRNVGLKEKGGNPLAVPRSSGVWDGHELATGSSATRNLSRGGIFGNTASRFGDTAERLMKGLDDVGLDEPVFGSAESYLWSLGVARPFQLDFVQPCTRARFSQNLTDVRGFSALMAARPSKPTAIEGGNTRLVERMIKLSEADLRLSSRVTKISPGHHRRYRLSVSRGPSSAENAEFDAVILAASLQSSKVDLSDLYLNSITPLPPYIETHVAQFTTPAAISPKFFDLPSNTTIPDDVLTASTTSGPDLLSLSRSTVCYRRGCMPGDDCDQCDWETLYRVLSRHRMDDGDLVRMIGQQLREGHVLGDYNISWAHRHAWPYAFPRYQKEHALLDRIEIAPQLFYLSGAEDAFSSMEMSCRMGHNAAGMLLYW